MHLLPPELRSKAECPKTKAMPSSLPGFLRDAVAHCAMVAQKIHLMQSPTGRGLRTRQYFHDFPEACG